MSQIAWQPHPRWQGEGLEGGKWRVFSHLWEWKQAAIMRSNRTEFRGGSMATASSTAAGKSFKFIVFDTSTFVARITMNHPPYNVLTVPMMTELAEAIESLNGRGDIKCIL